MASVLGLLLHATGAILSLTVACSAQEADGANEAAWLAEKAAMAAYQHEEQLQAARVLDLQSSGLARSEAHFGLELLRAVVADDPAANHIVAPLGTFINLCLAAEVANAPLRERLDAVLRVRDLDRPSLRRAIGTLRASFAARESAEIDIACAAWLRPDLQPAAGFVAMAGDGYGASVSHLDFAGAEALETINVWAEAATRGAIPRALPDLDPRLPWLLMTATSVTASWWWPFDRDESAPRAFTDAAGRVSHPVMMHILQEFPYVHDATLGAQIVGVRCDPEFSDESATWNGCVLYVVLPDADRPLPAVLDRLSDGPLSWRFAQLMSQSGHVTLPRFQVESSHSLAGALDRLGLGELTQESALTGLFPGKSLGLEVRDSATIIVDEEGPRAASVVSTSPFGFNDEPAAFSFVADRPFIYILFDPITGVMLFAGVLADPA